jgi:hypothetical protein
VCGRFSHPQTGGTKDRFCPSLQSSEWNPVSDRTAQPWGERGTACFLQAPSLALCRHLETSHSMGANALPLLGKGTECHVQAPFPHVVINWVLGER